MSDTEWSEKLYESLMDLLELFYGEEWAYSDTVYKAEQITNLYAREKCVPVQHPENLTS